MGALGRKVKVEPKGMKVGQVFLSQQQVKNILDKGILAPEHVDRTALEAAEAAKKAAAERHAAARKEAAEKAAAIRKEAAEKAAAARKAAEEARKATQEKAAAARKAAEEARKAAQEKAAAERAAALKAKEEKLAAEKAAAIKAKAEKEAAEKAAAEKAAAEEAAAEAARAADPLYQISGDKLRKLLRAYMELLKQATTLEDIAKVQELPEDKVRSLLVEITKRCKAAPVVEGRRAGFKLHSFFVNSTWVAKICESGLE